MEKRTEAVLIQATGYGLYGVRVTRDLDALPTVMQEQVQRQEERDRTKQSIERLHGAYRQLLVDFGRCHVDYGPVETVGPPGRYGNYRLGNFSFWQLREPIEIVSGDSQFNVSVETEGRELLAVNLTEERRKKIEESSEVSESATIIVRVKGPETNTLVLNGENPLRSTLDGRLVNREDILRFDEVARHAWSILEDR